MTHYIWKNGNIELFHEAKTHVMTHALHYGSGVFEGIRAYELSNGTTAILGLKEHVSRLFDSANTIALNIPFSREEIEHAILHTVEINSFKSCYIRPLAYYGHPLTSGIRMIPAEDTPTDVIIACYPLGSYLPEGDVHVKISDMIRLHPQSTNVSAKICGHYVTCLQAMLQLKGTKYSEAILLDYEGNVAEGSSDNIFIVKDNIIVTPECGSILRGITRNIVITLLKDLGLQVIEKKIKPSELFDADEIFLTGTAVEIRGVTTIDDKIIGNMNRETTEGITQLVKNSYMRVCNGTDLNYRNLLTIIN